MRVKGQLRLLANHETFRHATRPFPTVYMSHCLHMDSELLDGFSVCSAFLSVIDLPVFESTLNVCFVIV